MAHSNRKLGPPIRLTQREREALLGVIDNAIERMGVMGRNPELLQRIREKIADTGE